MPVSEFTGSAAADRRLLLAEKLIARYKCSLFYGLARVLVCNKTSQFQCEVQTCNWTDGHTVDLDYRVFEEEVVAIV